MKYNLENNRKLINKKMIYSFPSNKLLALNLTKIVVFNHNLSYLRLTNSLKYLHKGNKI
jgi:hypothetical protein